MSPEERLRTLIELRDRRHPDAAEQRLATAISGVSFEEAWATRIEAHLDGIATHFIARAEHAPHPAGLLSEVVSEAPGTGSASIFGVATGRSTGSRRIQVSEQDELRMVLTDTDRVISEAFP